MNNITLRKPLVVRLAMLFVVLFAGAAAPRALAKDICVAIIEPEVLADLPVGERKALAGALDTLLTESLAGRKGLVLVDRLALDKVLGERKAADGGLAKIDAKDVSESLRPFWSAGVLICSRMDVKSRALVIEAVSAQTGQLITSLYVGGQMKTADQVAKAVTPKLKAFVDNMAVGIARIRDKPLLEISGKLSGGMRRLEWMVDDLTEAAGARVILSDKVTRLAPRHPLFTKEERLLRVMGLAGAVKGDTAAGLSPVAQMRLTFELVDSAKKGIAFEKTPISLKLSLHCGKDKPIKTQIEGEVGKWNACRDKAVTWLDARLAAMDGDADLSAGDEVAVARKLAVEELAKVEQWTQIDLDWQDNLGRSIRIRMARHALRAAHLDPTNEHAAFLVAYHIEAFHDQNSRESTLLASDRSIAEAQRYIDRFKKKNPLHHRRAVYVIGGASVRALRKIRDGMPPKDDIVRSPITEGYPYARARVHTHADAYYLVMTDKRYAGNTFSTFGYELITYLIPCIPEDKLDDEYAYWKAFYATTVASIVRTQKVVDFHDMRPLPWDLIDAAFQARKKNSKGVREAFQRLAKAFPGGSTILWGGDRSRPPRIPMYLKAAGDPDWKTWRPVFGVSSEVNVSLDEMSMLMSGFSAQTPDYWDYKATPALVGIDLAIPDLVRKAFFEKGNWLSRSAEAVLVTGDCVWLIAPGVLSNTSGVKVRLFAARMKPDSAKQMFLDTQEISWDSTGKLLGNPCWSYAYAMRRRNNWVVFMGTYQHGLLRLDMVDGKWVGRWITAKNGLPSNGVSRLASCVNGDQTELLVIGGSMVSALNLDAGTVTLIHDTSKDKRRVYPPTALMKDGSKVLLEVAGSKAYAQPLDIGKIDKLIPSGASNNFEGPLPYTISLQASENQARLWWPNWNGFKRQRSLTELDPNTLKLVRSAGPPPGSKGRISLEVSDQVRRVLGKIASRFGSSKAVAMDRWPNKDVDFAVGGRDILWMAFKGRVNLPRCIVGYRPAPSKTKDWANEDLWIGPFKTLNGECITGLRRESDGDRLVLSTSGHVMLLDEKQLLTEAKKRGLARSTRKWRIEYDARLAKTGWQSIVPAMMLDKKYDDAIRMLDAQKASLSADLTSNRRERCAIDLWRGRVLAEAPGKIGESIKLYDKVARDPKSTRAAEAFARANQIVLLHRAKRWGEMLELARKVQARFPQMQATSARYGMGWYLADARKKLTAQTKASGGK